MNTNTKLATLAEMKADGWKQRTINGIKCLVLNNETETLICQWRRGISGFDPLALMEVISAYGKPDKYHYQETNVIGCIEYFT